MGKSHSKTSFSQWDLERFSNVTGIPQDTVNRLYQDFVAATGKNNEMDKKEFRRLYRELYQSTQPGPNVPAFIGENDLEKIADRVFKAFDAEGSGKLTFEEFVNAYLLLSRAPSTTEVTTRDRLNYVLDHNNPTPGYISREQGEQVFNNLNRYYTVEDTEKPVTTILDSATRPVTTTLDSTTQPVTTTLEGATQPFTTTLDSTIQPVTTTLDSATTSVTTTLDSATKPVTTTWEQHWNRLDDGTGRVPQEKFVEYLATSDDYKNHFDRISGLNLDATKPI